MRAVDSLGLPETRAGARRPTLRREQRTPRNRVLPRAGSAIHDDLAVNEVTCLQPNLLAVYFQKLPSRVLISREGALALESIVGNLPGYQG